MNRIKGGPALCLTLLLLVMLSDQQASAQSRVFAPDSTLQTLLERAYTEHPDMDAAQQSLEAANLAVRQAGHWQDPKLQISLANAPVNTFALDQEAMTALWVMMSQSIPLTGRYSTERSISQSDRRSAEHLQSLQQQLVAERTARAWYEWSYQRLAVNTIDSTVSLLNSLLETSVVRYETGSGIQQDLLRLQTELLKLREKRFEQEQNALKTARKLAASIGLDPSDIRTPPGMIQASFPELNRDSLRAALIERSPAIALSREETRKREEEAKLEKQKVFPNLTLSAAYGHRQDTPSSMTRADFLTVSAGINVPVFNGRQQSTRAQAATVKADAADAKYRSRKLSLLESLETLIDEDARHAHQYELYVNGIIPLAETTLQSALSAYSSGKIDVDAVITAEKTLLDAQLMEYKHLSQRAEVRISIAALIGEFSPKESSSRDSNSVRGDRR